VVEWTHVIQQRNAYDLIVSGFDKCLLQLLVLAANGDAVLLT
jgi:hypothetical protein